MILALFFPRPTDFQYTVFRIILALSAAGVGAVIPGFIEAKIKTILQAGGAIAVFVVVYFFDPARRLVAASGESVPEENKQPKREKEQPEQFQEQGFDFRSYLHYLKSGTMYLDIRGLVVGEGKAPQFRIDELYIPLKISGAGLKHSGKMMTKGELSEEGASKEVLLQEALKEPHLLIKGDPGSGKTTFLRLLAFSLCLKGLGEDSDRLRTKILWPDPAPLPILVSLGALTQHISACKKGDLSDCPSQKDSPEWLLHFLKTQSDSYFTFSRDMFQRKLKEGQCLIMFDGLDEAPNHAVREQVSSLAANLLKAYPRCPVVMSSRPAALIGKATPLEFSTVEIMPLDESAMKSFISQWSSALYSEAPEKSKRYEKELNEALTSRPEIRRMARTPVMLTALAVVHWNQTRLPEQRAELYESILTWLFRAREEREGRLNADRCRYLLQKLAFAMFVHHEGRQRQVGIRWAAEILEPEFTVTGQRSALLLAEDFLRDEIVDSGIIVERSNNLEFWHLSFQEYLTAYEIGGQSEKKQIETLFQTKRFYKSEWREVVLLLSGVLYKQGKDKINNLINTIIEDGPHNASEAELPLLAQEVGLLGSIVRDLSPFDFQPSNALYKKIVQSVMGIFDKKTFRSIPVQVREEAADALGRVGDPRFDREKDLWVEIPAGSLWMGAQKSDPKGRNYDEDADPWDAPSKEWPVHEVELSAYRIGKYPVTVCQYKRFIEEGGYEDEKYWKAGGFGKFKEPEEWEEQLPYPTRPVVSVSWYEAKAYASWSGCQLPTEAQWERAARGPGEEYRKYPRGNREPDKETMNYDESGIGHPTPVGIFPESCSPDGVIDMAGNVWEWCEDWYGDYSSGKVINPTGPSKGSCRVFRGGYWGSTAVVCRLAIRNRFAPGIRNDYLGFRLRS